MELLATVVEVGAYSERQYQRQDGTTEYFKSRGFTLKHGGDTIYGELTGEAASKNRDTQFYQNQIYVVKGFWKSGATTMTAMRTCSTLLTYRAYSNVKM